MFLILFKVQRVPIISPHYFHKLYILNIQVAGRVAAGRKFATRYPTRYPLANFPYQHGYPRGYPYPLPAVKTTKTDTKNSNFIDFLIKGTASASKVIIIKL